jgi:O-glycosyl hydrolase
MNVRKYWFVIFVYIFSAFCLVFFGCPDVNYAHDSVNNTSVPIITEHPTSVDYADGEAIKPLRVIAKRINKTGMGELGNLIEESNFTYQWFRADSFVYTDGTAISGATRFEFQPRENGYYYAVVTNPFTKISRTSHPARIRIGVTRPIPVASITIENTQRQYIRGFGGMSNAFADIINNHAYMETRDIDTMFNPENPDYLGLKVLRIKIYPAPLSDVLNGEYGMEEMKTSNALYVDFVKQVNSFGGYVVAAPWTPPVTEWKTIDSLMGFDNWIRNEAFLSYAEYLRDWAYEMASRGGPIYAISIQSEPTYNAHYYGMRWLPEQQRDFMSNFGHIITGMETNGYQINPGIPGNGGGITGPNLPNGGQRVRLQGASPHRDITWNNAALEDSTARTQLEIVAYHTNQDLNTRYALALDNEPRRETWMMENGFYRGGSNYPAHLRWGGIWTFVHEWHHIISHNDSSVLCVWYVKRFYSFIGDGTFGATNGAILPRGHAMAHFAKYLTDTVRLETSGTGFVNVNTDAQIDVINRWNQSHSNVSGIRAVAGMRTRNPAGYAQEKLKSREDLVTLVLIDSYTVFDDSFWDRGKSQEVLINLPNGFTASGAHGIISNPDNKRAPVLVVLSSNGKTATVTLPSNTIISLAFNGTWG